MNMKTFCGVAAIATSLAAPASAWAYSFGGGGNIEIKFKDTSVFTDHETNSVLSWANILADPTRITVGDTLAFTFEITSMAYLPSNTGIAGNEGLSITEELTGYASGLTISSFNLLYTDLGGGVSVPTAANVNFTGGTWGVYNGTGASFDYDPSTAASFANLVNEATNGTQVIGGDFGKFANNNEGTNLFTYNTFTHSNILTAGAITGNETYTAFLNLNQGVNGGSVGTAKGYWHENFDGGLFTPDNYGTGLELQVESTLTSEASVPGFASLNSNDPTRAKVIPEPGVLALVGIGLLGFSLSQRKRMI